jgi:glycosyltransferase involved in cell wall biosynthesis
MLPDTLASIARQALQPTDQVLIVYDSFQRDAKNADATRALVESHGFTFVEHDGGYHFYGNPQLNRAMELATGDYFCALGDDDVYVDGAIATIRAKVQPKTALLFQFYTPPFMIGPTDPRRLVLWADRHLRVANISGCCIVAPKAALVPVSPERRIEVDYDWIVAIVAKTGRRPTWLKEILIIARPDVRDGHTVHQGVVMCRGCGVVGFREDCTGQLCGDCAGVVIPEFLGAHA